MKDHYWFVDEEFRVLKGHEARQALRETSDAPYLSPDQGIVRIPRQRWEVAQTFERRGWMEKWIGSSDDRNIQHMADFDGYRSLRGKRFEHAIELGCGPFTNLRLIGQVCQINECDLLDPLVESYLEHPNCTYNRHELSCENRVLSSFWSLLKPPLGIRRIINKMMSDLRTAKHIPVGNLLASPIEEMPTHSRYDLVVIINVIEHCFDIDLVFQNITKIAAPNAILVFHDKYYSHENVSELTAGHYYEAGHPLMVDRHIVDGFLAKHCIPLYSMVIQKKIPHIDVMSAYEGVFFIGQFRD